MSCFTSRGSRIYLLPQSFIKKQQPCTMCQWHPSFDANVHNLERLITLSNCSAIFLDGIFNTCNLKELQVCLYWRVNIYIYIYICRSGCVLIFSFRKLFWLTVFYHERDCYVMTTRQPYFNRDYKITFCKREFWLAKRRVSIITVCKTWKGSRHYTAPQRHHEQYGELTFW